MAFSFLHRSCGDLHGFLHSPMELLGALLSFVLVLCSAVVWMKIEKRKLPPGPTPWPLVGNLFQTSPLLHRSFLKFSKKYGPLVFLRFGSMKILAVNSAAMAKAVFQTQDGDFCSRPQNNAIMAIITLNFQDFTMAEHGERWRNLKKFIVTELLSTRRIATFKSRRAEQVMSLVKSINKESEGGKAVYMRDLLYDCFLNITTTMIANKAYCGAEGLNNQASREFLGSMNLLVRLLGSLNPGDFFPFLKPFDVLGVERRSRECNDRILKFCQDIIDKHRLQRDQRGESYVEDFVDILLSCSGTESEKLMTDETIIVIIEDIILAGTETSSSTTEWAFTELMRHPEMRRKAQEELDAVVGRDRLVMEEDIPNLKYLGAILRENFRYHPVLASGVPHVSPKGGCYLEGYYIPENTTVMLNAWAIGRDPASWERPDEFDPERFLGSDTRDFRGQNFDFLPFGSGRRMCIGMNLGLIVTHLVLAQLLHCFEWSLPNGRSPESISMMEAPGFSCVIADPVRVIAKPRLAPDLYLDTL